MTWNQAACAGNEEPREIEAAPSHDVDRTNAAPVAPPFRLIAD